MVYETIIEAVRERQYLYDKSSPNYKNKDCQKAGFQEIANEINEMWKMELTAVNVEGIWKDLYDNFKVAYQKQKLQPSGSGAHENNISCEFYENLLFLADHIKHRPPVSSLPKCLNLQGNTRSIWQNSTNGEKVSQGINKKVKVPEWDHHAKLKYQKQENAFNVLADVSNTIKETSLKVIQAISQEEPATQNINTQSNIEKDYFNIYYDNLIKVNNEQRDDCVLAIVECIEECMK